MNDRELLELAAKAVGKGPILHNDGKVVIFGPNSIQTRWLPLFDDGDALRLLSKLRLSVNSNSVTVGVGGYTLGQAHVFVQEQILKGDVDSAHRRAIVRAAAEIGKNIK